MGFLDGLFGRRSRRAQQPDSVWQTGTARLAGLCARAERHAAGGQVFLLAHFPETLDTVVEALGGRPGVERAGSERDVNDRLAYPRAGQICLALVGQLPAQPPPAGGPAEGAVSFLVAERHPLRARDDRVAELAGALPYPAGVRFHLSLEDPLLERFLGERIQTLLSHLGMAPEEEISNPAVDRAVERVQDQLAARQAPEVEAESAEEWLGAIEPE